MTAKTSGTPQRGAPKYHRLTIGNRSIIWALRREGFSLSHIARQLGVARSTVTREVRRNTSHRGYRYQYADALARKRIAEKAARRRKFTEAMWGWAVARLTLGWSFAAISGRAKKEGVPMVCAETLYQEYYQRQEQSAEGEVLPSLPKAKRKRWKRGKRHAGVGAGHIPGRVDISERPAAVEERQEGGHWEGDLVNGAPGTGHLVTLVERTTRFTRFARVACKKDDEVAKAVIALLSPQPSGILRTLTFDSGKEFAKFK